MEREIKFRGLFTSQNGVKSFVYGNYIKSYCDGIEYHEIEKSTFEDFKKWTVDKESVGQYTGLHDKNGVEIYEGDVLEICNGSINGHKWPEPNRVVKYEKTGFNLHDFMWDKNGNSAMDSTHYCEIIGNIHTNPELLNNN